MQVIVKAQYRYIYFPKTEEYIGVAWEYDNAVLVSTLPYKTYSEASLSLIKTIDDMNTANGKNKYIRLSYFDGEYECTGKGDLLVPREHDDIVNNYRKPFT
jgi:hypothetical protein